MQIKTKTNGSIKLRKKQSTNKVSVQLMITLLWKQENKNDGNKAKTETKHFITLRIVYLYNL